MRLTRRYFQYCHTFVDTNAKMFTHVYMTHTCILSHQSGPRCQIGQSPTTRQHRQGAVRRARERKRSQPQRAPSARDSAGRHKHRQARSQAHNQAKEESSERVGAGASAVVPMGHAGLPGAGVRLPLGLWKALVRVRASHQSRCA